MLAFAVTFGQGFLLLENFLNHRDGNFLEMDVYFSHRSFSLDTPWQPSSDTGKIFWQSVDGESRPFSGISVARGMTNARTPSSDRSGKDCLCGTYFVVLYALIAYDYPRLVIRLIRKVPMKASL